MLRLIFFIGVGIGLGGVVVQLLGPADAGWWAIVTGLTVAVGAGVLLGITRSARGMALASPADIAAARAAGRSAALRVDAIRQTGTQINDQPVCDLDVTVQPVGGTAFRTVLRRIVRVIDVPRFQPGTVHYAVVLVPGGPEIAIDDSPIDAAKAESVQIPPVGDAGPVVRPEAGTVVVAGERRKPLLGVTRRGRPLRLVVFVAAAVLAAAAVAAPHQAAIASTLTTGRAFPDLRSSGQLGAALDAVAAEVGHDRVVAVTVHADFVNVDAPVAPDGLATDSWQYRAGQATRIGATPTQPTSPLQQFTASDVEWDALWPAARDAATEAGFAETDAVSLSVRRTVDSDIDSDSFGQQTGPVRVVFSARDDYSSIFFEMLPDASEIERRD